MDTVYKTPHGPNWNMRRNEESCADESRVLSVELIVEPVVPSLPATVIPVQRPDVAIAVSVVMYEVPSVPPPIEYSHG
jgi:hypothetical protein